MSNGLSIFKDYKVTNYMLMNMKAPNSIKELETRLSLEEKLGILNMFTAGAAGKVYGILLTLEQQSQSIKTNPDSHSYNLNSVRSFFAKVDADKYFYENVSNRSRRNYKFSVDASFGLDNLRNSISDDIFISPYTAKSAGGNGFNIVGTTEYGNRHSFTGYDVIHMWFNKLLNLLHSAEMKAFQAVDPFELKVSKIKDLGRIYGVFDNKRLNDIVWNKRPQGLTDEELDTYLSCYTVVEATVNKCVKKLQAYSRGQE